MVVYLTLVGFHPISMNPAHIFWGVGSLCAAQHPKAGFVKKYESKWGYTLFSRCLGPGSPASNAA